MNVKDCIKGNVKFVYYRDKQLFYQCNNGFIFPVPIEDVGTATFNKTEKGILLMRWIRKYIDALEEVKRNDEIHAKTK